MATLTVDEFENFFTYYKDQPHQQQAINLLYQEMLETNHRTLLGENSDWVTTYRTKPEPVTSNPLSVPYFWQQDNGPEGWRQCQTSSIAMCLSYLGVPGINDDVDYLPIVTKYGDTTLQSSHQQALKELGVKARFRTDMHKDDLLDEIDAGRPCAIGILHHGPVSAPSGGGHYITVRGYSDLHCLVHDPYGELDLNSGVWEATGPDDGKDESYSWKNLLPRWDIGGGWGWVFG